MPLRTQATSSQGTGVSLSGNANSEGLQNRAGSPPGVFLSSEREARPAEARGSVCPSASQDKPAEPPTAGLCSLGRARAALGPAQPE